MKKKSHLLQNKYWEEKNPSKNFKNVWKTKVSFSVLMNQNSQDTPYLIILLTKI